MNRHNPAKRRLERLADNVPVTMSEDAALTRSLPGSSPVAAWVWSRAVTDYVQLSQNGHCLAMSPHLGSAGRRAHDRVHPGKPGDGQEPGDELTGTYAAPDRIVTGRREQLQAAGKTRQEWDAQAQPVRATAATGQAELIRRGAVTAAVPSPAASATSTPLTARTPRRTGRDGFRSSWSTSCSTWMRPGRRHDGPRCADAPRRRRPVVHQHWIGPPAARSLTGSERCLHR